MRRLQIPIQAVGCVRMHNRKAGQAMQRCDKYENDPARKNDVIPDGNPGPALVRRT